MAGIAMGLLGLQVYGLRVTAGSVSEGDILGPMVRLVVNPTG